MPASLALAMLSALFEGVLRIVARHALTFERIVNGAIPELTQLVQESLRLLTDFIGRDLGADNIVEILVNLADQWGEEPFVASAGDPDFVVRVEEALRAAA